MPYLDLTALNPDALMIATIFAAHGVMDNLVDCLDAVQTSEMDTGIEMTLP